MIMQSTRRREITITGYVKLLPSDKADEEEVESDDDEDTDWPDFDEMSAVRDGGSFIKYSRPRKSTVKLTSLETDVSYTCEGRLHLTDAWWKVTAMCIDPKSDPCSKSKNPDPCSIHTIQKAYYSLRSDEYVGEHKLVTLFLSKVGNHHGLVEHFKDYIVKNTPAEGLTFNKLGEVMRKYLRGKDSDIMLELTRAIWQPEAGRVVHFAMTYPRLFETATKLLPSHFIKLAVSSRDLPAANLESLEEATNARPWVLGFKQILYGEFGVIGLEAQMPAWRSSNLIHNVPPVEKDALYIYHALKLISKREGHTYVRETDLKFMYAEKQIYFLKHTVTNWMDALNFLEDNEVIVRETAENETENRAGVQGNCVRVFLACNYYAETNAALSLGTVLGRKEPPKYWSVDLQSEDFANIHTDEEQLKAVHLMCNSPITVLSGKGGCGKTSVVTTLLSHACERSMSLNGLGTPRKTTPSPKVKNNQGNTTADESSLESNALLKDGNQDKEDTFLSETRLGKKILLTAPTGKAASLLGRKANMESCTLHSVIMSYKMYCIRKNKRRKENKAERTLRDIKEENVSMENPIEALRFVDALEKVEEARIEKEKQECAGFEMSDKEPEWTHVNKQIVIVDECSLVSVQTFATMMNILMEECYIKKIILLGDVRQLPSIEPGNFMEDIFKQFSGLGYGIELNTNHRAESQLIVDNATKISKKEFPVFDPFKRFHLVVPEDEGDNARDCTIRNLLKTAQDVQDPSKSQFVTFTGKVVEAVNEVCCQYYNKHSQRAGKKIHFKVGDKVCMRRNGTVDHHTVRQMESRDSQRENADQTLVAGDGRSVMVAVVGEPIAVPEQPVVAGYGQPMVPARTNNLQDKSVKRNLSVDFAADKNFKLQGHGVKKHEVTSYGGVDTMGEFSEQGDYMVAQLEMLNHHEFTVVKERTNQTAADVIMDFSEPREFLGADAGMINHHQIANLCQDDAPASDNETTDSVASSQPYSEGLDDLIEAMRKNQDFAFTDSDTDHSEMIPFEHFQEQQQGLQQQQPNDDQKLNVTRTGLTNDGNKTSEIRPEDESAATKSQKSKLSLHKEGSSSVRYRETSPALAGVDQTTTNNSTTTIPRMTVETCQPPNTKLAVENGTIGTLQKRPKHKVPEEIDERTDEFMIQKSQVKLCNGEVFFIERDFNYTTNDNKVIRYMSLSDRDEDRPRRVCVSYKQLMSKCKMRHSWARTIHTYQGSESQCVVYILSHVYYENWQHVYTAITRGRQSVYIIGNPGQLDRILKRNVPVRNTSLQEKLHKQFQEREAVVLVHVQTIQDIFKQLNTGKAGLGEGDGAAKGEKYTKGDNPASPLDFDSDDSYMCRLDNKGTEITDSSADEESSRHENDKTPTKSLGDKLVGRNNLALEPHSSMIAEADTVCDDLDITPTKAIHSHVGDHQSGQHMLPERSETASSSRGYSSQVRPSAQSDLPLVSQPLNVFTTLKRQRPCDHAIMHESPLKLQKMSDDDKVSVTPVRRSLNTLSINNNDYCSDDDFM